MRHSIAAAMAQGHGPTHISKALSLPLATAKRWRKRFTDGCWADKVRSQCYRWVKGKHEKARALVAEALAASPRTSVLQLKKMLERADIPFSWSTVRRLMHEASEGPVKRIMCQVVSEANTTKRLDSMLGTS